MTQHTPSSLMTHFASRSESFRNRAEKERKRSTARAVCEAKAELYLEAAQLVHGLIEVRTPTAEDYREGARKFRVAGNGDGPGIGGDDLMQIGVRPQPPSNYEGGSWGGFCAYVWGQLSQDQWPDSPARGRGRYSRDVGNNVAGLLEKLAEGLEQEQKEEAA